MRTKLPTLPGLLVKYLFYIPVGVFVTGFVFIPLFTGNDLGFLTVALLGLAIFIFAIIDSLRFIPKLYLINNRAKQVTSKLAPNSYRIGNWPYSASPMFDALERGDEGGRPMFQISGQTWGFMDYEFDKRTHVRDGEFVSSHVYYSVLQLTLPRKLPHIVFDSKRTSGKQMRFQFDRNQRISLEGNFDTYFDTYFPAHYEIDLLSIITPEVMEVLIQAKQFDIEIYGDSLKIYSSMVSPDQVVRMMQLSFSIRDKLMNNIVTYSDSRLAVDARKTVQTYGLKIQSNFRLNALKLALAGIPSALFTGVALFINEPDPGEKFENIAYATLTGFATITFFMSAIYTLKNGYKERKQRASTKYVDQPSVTPKPTQHK